MNRILIITSILIATVSFCTNKNNRIESSQELWVKDSLKIYGEWKITKFTAGDISEITSDEAQQYVGKIIVFSPKFAIINSDTCNNPGFNTLLKNSNEYFYSNNRIDKAALKIKEDSIKVIEISCNDNPEYLYKNSSNFQYDIIVLNNNLMLINFKGFYFYLEKVR